MIVIAAPRLRAVSMLGRRSLSPHRFIHPEQITIFCASSISLVMTDRWLFSSRFEMKSTCSIWQHKKGGVYTFGLPAMHVRLVILLQVGSGEIVIAIVKATRAFLLNLEP